MLIEEFQAPQMNLVDFKKAVPGDILRITSNFSNDKKRSYLMVTCPWTLHVGSNVKTLETIRLNDNSLTLLIESDFEKFNIEKVNAKLVILN